MKSWLLWWNCRRQNPCFTVEFNAWRHFCQEGLRTPYKHTGKTSWHHTLIQVGTDLWRLKAGSSESNFSCSWLYPGFEDLCRCPIVSRSHLWLPSPKPIRFLPNSVKHWVLGQGVPSAQKLCLSVLLEIKLRSRFHCPSQLLLQAHWFWQSLPQEAVESPWNTPRSTDYFVNCRLLAPQFAAVLSRRK